MSGTAVRRARPIAPSEIAATADAARNLVSAACLVAVERVDVTIEAGAGHDLVVHVRIDGRPSPSAERFASEMLQACHDTVAEVFAEAFGR